MLNTISLGETSFVPTKKNRVGLGDFKQLNSELDTDYDAPEIRAIIEMVSGPDAGRVWIVGYSFKGRLMGGNTIN